MTFPIVLAHGVCRFDILWNESLEVDNNDDPKVDRLHYFRGIRTTLKDKGFDVYHSRITFQTYAGRQNFWGIFNLLKAPFRIIEEKEGENDGLVSVQSAQWRNDYFKGTLDETDHLNELGWWDVSQLMNGETSEELLQRIHSFYATVANDLP